MWNTVFMFKYYAGRIKKELPRPANSVVSACFKRPGPEFIFSTMNLDREELISSALAGVLGTVGFGGFFLAIGNTGTIAMAIPALYGITGPSLMIGGLIHLIHGVILGVIYAAIISATGYGHHLDDVKKATAWGLGYGVTTTVLLAAVLMPVWLSTVGFPNAPTAPNFNPMGLVGHLIYGALLGASYPLIRSKLEK
jgi:hypothetical protein